MRSKCVSLYYHGQDECPQRKSSKHTPTTKLVIFNRGISSYLIDHNDNSHDQHTAMLVIPSSTNCSSTDGERSNSTYPDSPVSFLATTSSTTNDWKLESGATLRYV